VPTHPALPLVGEAMSWKATYWVKTLVQHPDGKPLTARQKLILFVLADYHHDEKGFAWVSVRRAAKEALTSPNWFSAITSTLEKHGSIEIERREGQSNLYRFPALCKPLVQSEKEAVPNLHAVPQSRVGNSTTVQSGTEPLSSKNLTDIAPLKRSPIQILDEALEINRRTKRPTDEILKELRRQYAAD
jgi:hypothetical protein